MDQNLQRKCNQITKPYTVLVFELWTIIIKNNAARLNSKIDFVIQVALDASVKA